jgi:hypothetical protein
VQQRELERPRRAALSVNEFAQRGLAAADERIAVCEQQVVEVEVEQPAKRLAQPGTHRRGFVAHQEAGHEPEPSAARAGEAVGERERAAGGGPDMQCGVIGADGAQLVCGDSRRESLAEREAFDAGAVLELV